MLKAVYEYKKQSSCKIIMTHHTYSFICTNDSLYNYSSCQLCEKCVGKFDKTIIKDNCYNNYIGSIMKYLQKNRMMRYMNGLIDIHIAPSYFMRDMLLKVNKSYRIEVIFNPCIKEIPQITDNDKDNKLVYFGRISKEKNILKIADLFSTLETSMKLLIIGTGDQSNELKEIIENSKNNNLIFINDFLNSDKLYNEIIHAKYFILPSVWYENSPVSIVEAISLGIVPIVSDIGGMKELIDYFKIGYSFNPHNDNSIMEVLKNITNENLLPNIDNNVILKLNEFTNENYKDNIIKIYGKVIK